MFFFELKSKVNYDDVILGILRVTYCAPPLPLRPNGLCGLRLRLAESRQILQPKRGDARAVFPAHAYELTGNALDFLFRPMGGYSLFAPCILRACPAFCPETCMRSPLCSLFVAGIFPSARVGVPPWVPPTLAPCTSVFAPPAGRGRPCRPFLLCRPAGLSIRLPCPFSVCPSIIIDNKLLIADNKFKM